MKAVVAAFNQEKALVGAFSVITNLRRQLFEALLRIERDVLDWLVEQRDNDEIEEVTDEILDKLIEGHQALIAVFCKHFFLFIRYIAMRILCILLNSNRCLDFKNSRNS